MRSAWCASRTGASSRTSAKRTDMRMMAFIACALLTTPANAARPLPPADAVDLAFRPDPQLAGARIVRDKSRLATLRANLDRISFKVDGTLQEIWNKTNLGGPLLTDPFTGMVL